MIPQINDLSACPKETLNPPRLPLYRWGFEKCRALKHARPIALLFGFGASQPCGK
jgi:hypothetical protein